MPPDLAGPQGGLPLLAMPTGRYDVWAGHQSLYDPMALPLDAEIARFAGNYRIATRSDQERTRSSLTTDEGYRLLTFAQRAAVFAMRQRDEAMVALGLGGCAALDGAWVDERDISVALAMLHHAAGRIGANAAIVLRNEAAHAGADVAALFEGFLARRASERDLRDAWGRVEVEAPGGVGLLNWGFRPWMPTTDLVGAGVGIAAIINAHDYLADDPTLAVEMPEIWLSEAGHVALGSILGSARGTLLVHGRLRPVASAQHASQQLSIWLIETSDPPAARLLQEMAGHGHQGAALLGVSRGIAFVLVVARSFVRGDGAYETTASLARFAGPIARALADSRF